MASGEMSQSEFTAFLTTVFGHLPVRARFRGGRSGLLAAPGSALKPAGPDAALIKAVARAHRWKAMLMNGEVRSIEALATQLGQERRHVGCTLALAFLRPAITKAILAGQQPAGLRLSHLLDADRGRGSSQTLAHARRRLAPTDIAASCLKSYRPVELQVRGKLSTSGFSRHPIT